MNLRLFAFILISLFWKLIISGQPFTEKNTYSKSIPVNRDVILELDNRYGAINITPWNKDVVSVKAEIEAFAPNQERLRNMINGIDVAITEAELLVRVRTEFSQGITKLIENFKEITSKVIPYESGIQINYFITAPEYLDMKIINKYGDVLMENSTGKLSLELSNGSFKANSVSEAEIIELVFCDVTINNVTKGVINTSFSDVEINESQNLTLTSVSSKFYLKQAAIINIDSRRDKFTIGTVSSVSGISYFTDYYIGELLKDINLDTKYGDLNIDLIDENFELVSIKSTYMDITLTLHKATSYNLDIKHLNAFLILPEKSSDISKKTINEDKKEFMTYGTVGNNPGNRKVLIDANRGNIHIK